MSITGCLICIVRRSIVSALVACVTSVEVVLAVVAALVGVVVVGRGVVALRWEAPIAVVSLAVAAQICYVALVLLSVRAIELVVSIVACLTVATNLTTVRGRVQIVVRGSIRLGRTLG